MNVQLTKGVGDSGCFMTMFYLTTDQQSKSLEWVRAGHDPAIICETDTALTDEESRPARIAWLKKGTLCRECVYY